SGRHRVAENARREVPAARSRAGPGARARAGALPLGDHQPHAKGSAERIADGAGVFLHRPHAVCDGSRRKAPRRGERAQGIRPRPPPELTRSRNYLPPPKPRYHRAVRRPWHSHEVSMFKGKAPLPTFATLAGAIVLLLATAAPQAQQRAAAQKVTSPKDQFG